MIRFLANPLISAGAAFLVATVLGGIYGAFKEHAGHKRGTMETTAAFVRADEQGEKNVRDIAKEVLSSIDGVDPDELLRRTGGLRPDD